MKRNQIIIIAIAAFVMLWMYSQSGNASQEIFDNDREKLTEQPLPLQHGDFKYCNFLNCET